MKTQAKQKVTGQKVTVTLPTDMVQALDEQARVAGGSRSAVLVRVLDAWHKRKPASAMQLEEDTAAYYQSQDAAEQDEDDTWAAFAAHAATQT